MFWQTAGALTIAVVLYDVFRTIFHAQGRGGPLNRRMNRAIWGLARRVVPHGREDTLGFVGPILICATLLLWVTTLIAGFTLVYFPEIDSFLVSTGSLRTPWLEALYFSAYTASTLGIGDLIPDTSGMRLLSTLQALLGFALVSVSVTYLLSVYRELQMMRSLASDVSGFLDANSVETTADLDRLPADAVDRWARDVDRQLGSTLEAHFLYPLIHYFRSSDDDSALPVQMGRLQRLCGDAPSGAMPALVSLCATVRNYVRTVDRRFVPGGAAKGEPVDVEAALDRLLRYMRYR